MSRIKELKEKYPHLNVSFFDIMTRLDISKSNKYLPLICKIFSKRFDVIQQHGLESENSTRELNQRLSSLGINVTDLTPNQIYVITHLIDYFNNDSLNSITQFMELMEKGLIEQNDVSKYEDLDSLRGAITLAAMKEWRKDLEGEVIKEYEDDKWVVLRPLTFAASAKYGATTRWCTTYSREKQYFEKYWRKGILVYFINKISGYKFAGYKALDGENELSFWNQEDQRVDYLLLDVDDYLFPITRKIFSSQETNKNLCSPEIQEQVHSECLNLEEKLYAVEQPTAVLREAVEEYNHVVRNLWVSNDTEPVPVYEQPDIA